jgi:hypothetical protein
MEGSPQPPRIVARDHAAAAPWRALAIGSSTGRAAERTGLEPVSSAVENLNLDAALLPRVSVCGNGQASCSCGTEARR